MSSEWVFATMKAEAVKAEESGRIFAVTEVGGLVCTADLASFVVQSSTEALACHIYICILLHAHSGWKCAISSSFDYYLHV